MRITRRAFQRIALVALAVCVLALIGPRVEKVDRDHIEVEFGQVHGETDDYSPKGQHAADTSRDEVFYDETFAISAGDLLRVELASSDLVIEKGSSSAQARVVIRGEGRDAAAEFERRRFSADYSGGTLRVRSNPERRHGNGDIRAGFTVVVTIPARMNANVALASGDVRLDELVGTLELGTASGDIEIGSVQGPSISIGAASGDITARSLDGRVSVGTASGDINIRQIIGSSVELSAASGDITIESVEADQMEASSASGDVEVGRLFGRASVSTASGDVSLSLADAANISTTSGSVSLHLPQGAGFDVDLESSDIEIDGSLGFRGSRERRHARGTLGSGGPRLEISTTSGSIELNTE